MRWGGRARVEDGGPAVRAGLCGKRGGIICKAAQLHKRRQWGSGLGESALSALASAYGVHVKQQTHASGCCLHLFLNVLGLESAARCPWSGLLLLPLPPLLSLHKDS